MLGRLDAVYITGRLQATRIAIVIALTELSEWCHFACEWRAKISALQTECSTSTRGAERIAVETTKIGERLRRELSAVDKNVT